MSLDNEYIFTFGFGQGRDNGFFSITAADSEEARGRMFDVFGGKWSMQYDAPDAREKAGVEKFGLWEVK